MKTASEEAAVAENSSGEFRNIRMQVVRMFYIYIFGSETLPLMSCQVAKKKKKKKKW